jgi:hypothetical protein
METNVKNLVMLVVVLLSAAPPWVISQETNAGSVFKPEELEQILAPVALYPDSLLSQVLMASTYPLEVVQAQRWAQANKSLTGDALATELEKQTWDPSVKSLVNFPEVLTMMSEKLDWTQKLGDAFLAQQKEVMDTVQKLRKKAEEQGNLKTTEQQVVKTEQQTIIVEYANPQVVYVPTYDPVVIYGTWPYPAYPPYYYYPPAYSPGSNLLAFGAGVAVGAAWGYAWGDCDWHGGDVDIDINQNTNINQNIDRSKYKEQFQQSGRLDQSGKGNWQHSPEHRKGTAYRDPGTAQKFNRASTNDAVKSREEFRGRAEQGRQDLARGGADQFKGRADAGQRDLSSANRAATRDVSSRGSSGRGGAFEGMERGSSAKNNSSRGSASRQSMSRPSGGGASRGGGARGGGGGRR